MFSPILKSRFFIPSVIVISGAAISTGLYFSSSDPVKKPIKASVILVDALLVKKSDVVMTVRTQGEVRAKTRTRLVSEVSGIINRVSPDYVAGGAFERGDTLIGIDDRNYVANVKQARAAIASAETKLAEEQGLAEYAQADWKRSNRAGRKPASDLALRKPQIAEARTNLEFALADLVKKEGDLRSTQVKAFYNGIVESKEVDLGQFVSPGTEMGVVFSIDYVEVRLPIALHEIEFLELPQALSKTNKKVAVTFSSIGDQKPAAWSGVITRTEAVMDRKNRVLYAIAEVKNPYLVGENGWSSPLRVGSFVDANIEGKRFNDIIVIPRAAIRPGNKIWIINAQNRLELRIVKPIRADENYLYIDAGLEDGDILSITPLENPLPGTSVRFRLISEKDLLTGT